MRTWLIKLIMVLLPFQINAQAFIGEITNYWPSSPSVYDTLRIEIKSTINIVAPNGPNCGEFLHQSDTIIGSRVEIESSYRLIQLGQSTTHCIRYDTLSTVLLSAGQLEFIVYWNIEGTSPVGPFNVPRYYSDTISLSVSGVTDLDDGNSSVNLNFTNPISSSLKLFGIPENETVTSRLFNLNGQLIWSSISSKTEYDLSEIENGLYIISIETSEGRLIDKLVVNR